MKTLAAVTLAVAFLAVPVGTAQAAAPTCQGQEATVVGTPGGNAIGTEGPDVVVSNGAASTSGLAGDDLICVTGDTGKQRRVKVYAGDGADRVEVSGGDDTFIELGNGEDVAVGGDHADTVYGGWIDNLYRDHLDDAADRISTGPGNDAVVSGLDGLVNEDVIDLGGGDDFVNVSGASATGVAGGTGENTLQLRTSGEAGPAGWVLDTRARTASRDGVVTYAWADFDGFDLQHLGYELPLRVDGSPRGERFLAEGRGLGSGPLTLDAGGGGDLVTVGSDHVGKIGLGAGRDRLEVFGNGCETGKVEVKLGAGRVETECDQRTAFKATHVEDVLASGFGSATVRGTESANTLELEAVCSMNVLGKDGSDVIRILGYLFTRCGASGQPLASAVLQGGGGGDVLSGGSYADVLLGGPGHDVAQGNGGSDACRAEVRRSCERH